MGYFEGNNQKGAVSTFLSAKSQCRIKGQVTSAIFCRKLIFLSFQLIFLIMPIDKINFPCYNAINMNPQISTKEV